MAILTKVAELSATLVRSMPLFYGEAGDVIGQYAKAFEKVWANRAKL